MLWDAIRKNLAYAGIGIVLVGCANTCLYDGRAPNPTSNISFSEYDEKKIEARGDIEEILARPEFERFYNLIESRLSFVQAGQVGKLQCFEYSDNHKLNVKYFTEYRNSRFARYAERIEIRVDGDTSKGEPYLHFTLYGKNGGMDPKKPIRVKQNKVIAKTNPIDEEGGGIDDENLKTYPPYFARGI